MVRRVEMSQKDWERIGAMVEALDDPMSLEPPFKEYW